MHTTLPRPFYADPDFYRAELERFYFNRWICAGRADQIPNAGDYFTRTLGDESIIIARDGSGAIHALFNVCRHRGTRLCEQTEGHFADRIQCPYHNWTYGLEGRLLAAPHMPPDFSKDDYPLHRAGCEVWDGNVFIHLGQEGRGPEGRKGLREQLADLPERFAGVSNGRSATWPASSCDCSRELEARRPLLQRVSSLPNLHPALNKLHHYLGADNVAPTLTPAAGAMGFRDGVETMSMDGQRRQAYLPALARRR